MVGFRHLATRSPPIAVKSLENMSMKVFGCISLMSAPAAKAFSPPASRMQPIFSSASRSSTASAISLKTPKDSALSIFGRFSVTMPTAPLISTVMYSNVLMVDPAPVSRQCACWQGCHQVGGRFDNQPENAKRADRVNCLGHEHPCRGSERQDRAEADEDLPDQRGLIPRRASISSGGNRDGC